MSCLRRGSLRPPRDLGSRWHPYWRARPRTGEPRCGLALIHLEPHGQRSAYRAGHDGRLPLLPRTLVVLILFLFTEGRRMTLIAPPDVVHSPSEAKIQLPVQRRGLVKRGGLLERLAAVRDDVPLVLLTAPPGYGKTTALSQWIASDCQRFGWVTL